MVSYKDKNKDKKMLYYLYNKINIINDKIDLFVDIIDHYVKNPIKNFYSQRLYDYKLSKIHLNDKYKERFNKQDNYLDKMKDKDGIIHLFYWYKD